METRKAAPGLKSVPTETLRERAELIRKTIREAQADLAPIHAELSARDQRAGLIAKMAEDPAFEAAARGLGAEVSDSELEQARRDFVLRKERRIAERAERLAAEAAR